MSIIKIDSVSKQYRLGLVGTGTVQHDLVRWWDRIRGKEDRFLKIGETNDRSKKGDSEYVWALKDISFEVQPGEVLGIIGRNGAGKSTLLKILSRVTQPSTGRIEMHGRVASLLEVGTGLHPDLTGRENIYLNGAILGMNKKEIDRKLDEIIDFAGVERYIDTPVKRYSSGMHVRLGFAVAAHLEPEILIVDEVLAVGDAEFQKKCLGKMESISKEGGRTVLFVSHNLPSVEALCSRVIVLQNGLIDFIGETATGIGAYLRKSILLKSNAIQKNIGIGPVRISYISVTDSMGNILDTVQSGSSFSINLHFRCPVENFPDGVIPGVMIKNDKETPVATHHSRLTGIVYKKLPESGCFTLHVPSIKLAPGNYFISYSLVSNNVIIDTTEEYFPLSIVDSNYYGHGEMLPSSLGFSLLDGQWTLLNSNVAHQ